MNLTDFTLLRQGAEARLYLGTYLGQRALVKERFSKKYRHPDLDARLTKDRSKAEVRALIKCKNIGIRTPKLYHVDQNKIVMEYVDCPTARDYIRKVLNNENTVNSDQKIILQQLGSRIGVILAQLHQNHVIHGDLTTSNILVENINCCDAIATYRREFCQIFYNIFTTDVFTNLCLLLQITICE